MTAVARISSGDVLTFTADHHAWYELPLVMSKKGGRLRVFVTVAKARWEVGGWRIRRMVDDWEYIDDARYDTPAAAEAAIRAHVLRCWEVPEKASDLRVAPQVHVGIADD